MTRARATADTQDNNGGSVSPFVAGKNRIINSDLYWNQRNFSSTTSNGTFMADRWYSSTYGGTVTFTWPTIAYGSFSGQTSNRVFRITSGSSSNDAGIATRIEDVATFAGQTITVSYWVRSSGSTYATDLVEVFQYFGSGGSASVYTYADVAGKTFSGSWTRLSFQVAIPSVAGKTITAGNFLNIRIDPAVSIASGEWVELTHIQAEAGSVATPFTTATGNPASELAACQRYYWRAASGDGNTVFGSGWGWTGTTATLILYPKVTLRTKPTSVDFSGVVLQALPGGTTYAITSWPVDTGLIGFDAIATLPAVASGLTAGTNYRIFGSSSASYVGLSAEL